MTFRRFLRVACVLLAGTVCAQTEKDPDKDPAKDKREKNSRHVRFLAVGDLPTFRQQIRDGVAYEQEPPAGSIPPREVSIGFGDDKPETVPLLLGRITDPLKVPDGAGPLILRRKEDGAEAQPWLSLDRPQAGDFLVLLWRDAVKGTWEATRSLVLPYDVEAAPAGTMRVINISPVAIGVVYGGERIALQPGKSYQRPVIVGKDADFQIGAVDQKGELRRIHSGTVFQNPGERTLAIVYRADGEDPRRALKAIVQREPVPAAPPQRR